MVTPEALEPFQCEAPPQSDPQPLPYLRQTPQQRTAYDICLTADIIPAGSQQPYRFTSSNARHIYWTFPQVGHVLMG